MTFLCPSQKSCSHQGLLDLLRLNPIHLLYTAIISLSVAVRVHNLHIWIIFLSHFPPSLTTCSIKTVIFFPTSVSKLLSTGTGVLIHIDENNECEIYFRMGWFWNLAWKQAHFPKEKWPTSKWNFIENLVLYFWQVICRSVNSQLCSVICFSFINM